MASLVAKRSNRAVAGSGSWRKRSTPSRECRPVRRRQSTSVAAFVQVTDRLRYLEATMMRDERESLAHRPRWMTALAVFCLASVLVLVARDLFHPPSRDVEVWVGFELHGTAARLTAPLHWIIFLVGAWGFWSQRPWIVPAAAAYAFYIALSHLVWSEASPNGHGWVAGLAQALVLSIPGVLLLRARRAPARGGHGS